MTFIPKPHEIYKHFKGNLYQIVTIAQHSETGEQLVIYQAMYGDFKTYARPLAMFTSEVDKVKYPEVQQRFRFELQGADADRQTRENDEVNGGQTTTQAVPTATAQDAAIWTAQAATVQDAATVAAQATAQPASVETQPEEPELDPLVLEFLDADSYEQKLNILAGLHHRITDEMITTMAIACDIEVNDGETEERYEELKNCLLTMEKFECNRLR
ncbi:DUF1653 domain-containing protein [Simiaoa sp.]|uniref:DUF1653 domain-containing protein n=1 Tax=Simiaoa sp. TaxID=2944202 RepID=UPI003F7F8461